MEAKTTMSEPDELYTLRAQYWLGHYRQCVEEGKSVSRRPMGPQLKNEREEFVLRAQLALGEYDKVLRETEGSDRPSMRALGLHASYESCPDPLTRDSICETLKAMLAEPESANSTSFQLTACHIFLRHGLTREALQCVHLGMTMEHLAVSLQIYLKIDRLDLAEEQLRLMKQADEDSLLTQLCSAYLGIAGGRSTVDDAVHVLASLSEQYGPSVMLLNVTAVANLVKGNYDTAEAALAEAAQEHGNDADTLINTIACYWQMGKGGDTQPFIAKLKSGHPLHPYVQALDRVASALDREAVKYST